VPGEAEPPLRELNMSLDGAGRCYLDCDALCSVALIWCLVCTAMTAFLPARRGHGCTAAYPGPLFPRRETHTKARKALQCTPTRSFLWTQRWYSNPF